MYFLIGALNMFLLIDVNFFVIKVKEGHLVGKDQYIPVNTWVFSQAFLLHPEDACRHLNIQFINPIISIISSVDSLYSLIVGFIYLWSRIQQEGRFFLAVFLIVTGLSLPV